MTPFSPAHTELALLVAKLEDQARQLEHEQAGWMRWSDHRTNAVGQLWETFDRIEPGLGLRLVHALYPGVAKAAADAVWSEVVHAAHEEVSSFGGTVQTPDEPNGARNEARP